MHAANDAAVIAQAYAVPDDKAYGTLMARRGLGGDCPLVMVLGPDWHLAALSLRAPLPGCGHQGLHPDFEQRWIEGRWQTLSAMWCITAFTPRQRAAAGHSRLAPGERAADRHAGVRVGYGPAPR